MSVSIHESLGEYSNLILHGSVQSLENLSLNKKSLNKLKLGEYGLSLLHLAVWHNRIDICKYLIDKGMDPDVREKYSGKTPLHIAGYLGNIECAQTLFENGAEVLFSKRSVDDVGCHPAHYAAMTGSKELIDFFLKIPKLDRFRIKRYQ